MEARYSAEHCEVPVLIEMLPALPPMASDAFVIRFVAEVVRGDGAEDVRGHHAQRVAVADVLAKRAGPVAEDDPAFRRVHEIEVALDTTLQVDQHVCDALPVELFHAERAPVHAVDPVANALPDDAHESGGLLLADHLF
jgi:hypothetical protein